MGSMPLLTVPPGGWDDPFTMFIPKLISTGLSVFIIWQGLLNAQGRWWFGILLLSAWVLWVQSFFIVVGIKQ